MAYVVTARKWRPMVFEDVIGQSHVTTTLRNAITTNRLSHAYLFSGPRGIGKTTTARILAKAINCLHPKESNPDNACEICTEITEGRSVNVFEIDGASNRGVEDVRNLRDAIRYGPASGKYKVYIIDEVHMLTKEAFNALLKTLEEPPPYILFIFATTEVHKVPLTILSRCQRFDFRRITIEEVISRLKFIAKEERITIDNDTLFVIAKKADGSMRDAQSLFDQIVSFCGDNVTAEQIAQMLNIVDQEVLFRVTELIRAKDAKGMLDLVEEIIGRGYDLREFLVGLSEHLRNMLVVLAGSANLIEASEPFKHHYQKDASLFAEADLLRLLKVTAETMTALRWSQQPRYTLEIGLLQMVKMDSSVQIEQLLAQLDELRKKVNGEHAGKVPLFESKVHAGIIKSTSVEGNPRPDQREKPSQTASEPISAYRQTANPKNVTALQSRQQPEANPLSLSIEDASRGWSTVIEEMCKHRIAVGSMLSETAPVQVSENTLRIGCPDDYHLDAFKRNREYISGLAQKIYGGKVKLEAILSSISAPPAQPIEETKEHDTPQHPVIQALIRELGAEQVE